jgi:hypothetical protein
LVVQRLAHIDPWRVDRTVYQVGITMESDGDEHDRLSFARRNGVSVNKERDFIAVVSSMGLRWIWSAGDRQQSTKEG